jgi:hypothetical protein
MLSYWAWTAASALLERGRTYTATHTHSCPRTRTQHTANTTPPPPLPTPQVMELMSDADAGHQLEVDLPSQTVIRQDGSSFAFEVDAFRKHCLLNGLDDIGLTLQKMDQIRAFEVRAPPHGHQRKAARDGRPPLTATPKKLFPLPHSSPEMAQLGHVQCHPRPLAPANHSPNVAAASPSLPHSFPLDRRNAPSSTHGSTALRHACPRSFLSRACRASSWPHRRQRTGRQKACVSAPQPPHRRPARSKPVRLLAGRHWLHALLLGWRVSGGACRVLLVFIYCRDIRLRLQPWLRRAVSDWCWSGWRELERERGVPVDVRGSRLCEQEQAATGKWSGVGVRDVGIGPRTGMDGASDARCDLPHMSHVPTIPQPLRRHARLSA